MKAIKVIMYLLLSLVCVVSLIYAIDAHRRAKNLEEWKSEVITIIEPLDAGNPRHLTLDEKVKEAR